MMTSSPVGTCDRNAAIVGDCLPRIRALAAAGACAPLEEEALANELADPAPDDDDDPPDKEGAMLEDEAAVEELPSDPLPEALQLELEEELAAT